MTHLQQTVRTRMKFLMAVLLSPRLAGRVLRTHPASGTTLLAILFIQYGIAVWLFSQCDIAALIPWSYLLAWAVPIRTLLSFLFASALLAGFLDLVRRTIRWRVAFAVLVHSGAVLILGDVVKALGGLLVDSVRGVSLPGIASIIHPAGAVGAVLGELHLFAFWFLVVLAQMLAAAARIRTHFSLFIAVVFWTLLTVMRVVQFSVLNSVFH